MNITFYFGEQLGLGATKVRIDGTKNLLIIKILALSSEIDKGISNIYTPENIA